MKRLLITALFSIAFGSLSQAAVTYQFSVSGTNRATGFAANGSLTGTDGMRYGLVFDTNGDGFSGWTGNGTAPASATNGIYDVFTNTTSGFLTSSSLSTGDYYWVPGNTTPFTNTLTDAGSDTGGAGGILSSTLSPVGSDVGLPSGLSAGDKFAIIWFQSTPAEGSFYGLFTDPTFVVQASAITPIEYNAPFLGSNDPIKNANLQFPGATVVPEPSRLMLLGLGFFGLFFRRRR